ncbi:MAG: hypothetical protein ABMB14_05215 [Myxococcota bacterium]
MVRVVRCGAIAAVAGCAGCAGAGLDVDGPATSDPTDAPPIAGRYDAVWEDPAGCDATDAPVDWAEGEVVVTGSGAEVGFAFGDPSSPVSFSGAIDASFAFDLAGVAELDGWSLAVDAQGVAYSVADRWVLEGELTMDATDPDGNSCTRSGTWSATQIEVAR